MRSLIYVGLVAVIALPTAAQAQPEHRAELRQDRHEIRRDIRKGDWREAREDRQELREDRRDAWREHRARNRALYHRPAYVGPAGYRYRAWRPGVRLPVIYYGPRYLIADPWQYRLPRVSGRERWVRYGNDALLVNTRTGVIRDVIHNFFW